MQSAGKRGELDLRWYQVTAGLADILAWGRISPAAGSAARAPIFERALAIATKQLLYFSDKTWQSLLRNQARLDRITHDPSNSIGPVRSSACDPAAHPGTGW